MSDTPSLQFVQGETVSFPVTVTDSLGVPIDLSGATIKSDIRKEYNTDVVASFTIEETDLLNGQFALTMTSVTSEALPMNTTGRITSFVFDVDVYYPGGNIETIISGYLKVVRGVTSNV